MHQRLLLPILLAVGVSVLADDVVTPPPAPLEAPSFYRKHLDASGLPILGSDRVTNHALREARVIVDGVLAVRDDIRRALVDAGACLVVMHSGEVLTDVPEHRDLEPKAWWDRRVRGRAGRVTSCGEENLLGAPGDRHDGESVLIHELAHTIHSLAVEHLVTDFDERLDAAFHDASAAGLWRDTHAATHPREYWAEGVQTYFDANRTGGAHHGDVDTREELAAHDPALHALVDAVFAGSAYRWARPLDRGRARFDGKTPGPGSPPEFTPLNVQGWLVWVDTTFFLDGADLADRAIDVLVNQLFQIKLALSPEVLLRAQDVPLWLRETEKRGGIAFHPNRQWLVDRGHAPPYARSLVEFDASTLVHEVHRQPWLAFHEMVHGYDWFHLGEQRTYGNDAGRRAYEAAMKSGKYERALHWDGRQRKPYHATNKMEFFAECSEAYFGTNDIFPFVRAELRAHDPATLRMVEARWEVDATKEARRIEEALGVLDTPMLLDSSNDAPAPAASAIAHERHDLEGWVLHVDPRLTATEFDRRELRHLLRRDLHVIARYLPPRGVAALRTRAIWVEVESPRTPFVAYHPRSASRDRAGSVEIGSFARYRRLITVQPSALLHVLAAAWFEEELGAGRVDVTRAWNRARRSGVYDDVLRFDGSRVRHPALASPRAFFAELTEALHGTGDHEPFVRIELAERDRETHDLLLGLWRGTIARF